MRNDIAFTYEKSLDCWLLTFCYEVENAISDTSLLQIAYLGPMLTELGMSPDS